MATSVLPASASITSVSPDLVTRGRLLHIERQRRIGRRIERDAAPDRAGRRPPRRQADAGERAFGAFRAVDERRRQPAGGRGKAQIRDGLARFRAQRIVERDAHAARASRHTRWRRPSRGSRVFEDERLGADLHALGVVGAFGDMGALALLVSTGVTLPSSPR